MASTASPNLHVVPFGLFGAEMEREELIRSSKDGLDSICSPRGPSFGFFGDWPIQTVIHFKDKSVDLTTSPNTSFVKALLDSFDVHSIIRFTRGYGAITIRADKAAKIAIFNPEIDTYRRKLLEKLVGANVYPRHCPSWLTQKVDHLDRFGLSKREICERILYEDNTYVKLFTLSKKTHH